MKVKVIMLNMLILLIIRLLYKSTFSIPRFTQDRSHLIKIVEEVKKFFLERISEAL